MLPSPTDAPQDAFQNAPPARPTDAPIFVVGSGRSGTTLMRSLLSAHPRIAIAPETHYLKQAARDAGSKGDLTRGRPRNLDAFWRTYAASTRFADLGVDPERCRALMHEAPPAAALPGEVSPGEVSPDEPPTYRAVFHALLAAYAERTGAARVGEKTPSHVRHIGRLLEWFPEARIVVMRRDPRAVLASKMRNPWVTRHIKPASLRNGFVVRHRLYTLAVHVRDWAELYEEIVPAWSRDERVLVVSYEALVGDTAGELERICAFAGEAYDPAMLASRSAATVPAPAGEVDDAGLQRWRREHHAKSRRPVSSASLDKWRRELAPLDVAMIEGGCQGGMEAAGYACSAPPSARMQGRALTSAVYAAGRLEGQLRAAAGQVLRRVPHRLPSGAPARSH